MPTDIEWTNETLNVSTGCSHESEGCRNCYAEAMSHRFKRTTLPWTARNSSENIRLHEDRLIKPLGWRRPRMIFVNSMSDLFHPLIPFEFIDKVFAMMGGARQHTFQVLTKRPARMREYLLDEGRQEAIERAAELLCPQHGWRHLDAEAVGAAASVWPLPNVWLGTTVEQQREADLRIPHLVRCPAAVHFLSCEPLLGPVDLTKDLLTVLADAREDRHPRYRGRYPFEGCGIPSDARTKVVDWLDWVICGGESGPKARPMHPDWARQLRDACAAAGVPYFFKQWGTWAPSDVPTKDAVHNCGDGRCRKTMSEAPGHFVWMKRRSKKANGRILDGRTHDGLPGAARV